MCIRPRSFGVADSTNDGFYNPNMPAEYAMIWGRGSTYRGVEHPTAPLTLPSIAVLNLFIASWTNVVLNCPAKSAEPACVIGRATTERVHLLPT